MNLANRITILRILIVPVFIALVLYSKWELAIIVFAVAAGSDALDGYVARKLNQKTELGTILDPIADKMLILSAFICLAVSKSLPLSVKPPIYVPIIIISRDAIILLGALLIHVIKGKLQIIPSFLSKSTTFLQMITVISIILRFDISPILWNLAVGFTVISGADYIIKGSRILNEK